MSKASDVRRRYDLLARAYNIVTLDRLVYGRARQRAIDLLHLREGDTVLDVGCGTGLSLRGLREAVGTTGMIIGIDLSAEMLREAQQQVETEAWTNVRLLQADASDLKTASLPAGVAASAALFALSLSAMESPRAVLQSFADALPAGARVAVMDAGTPSARRTPFASFLRPVWEAVFKLAAADPGSHPWEHLPDLTDSGTVESFHFGFVRTVAGVVHTVSRR